MTPEQQSAQDKQAVNIQFHANGYSVNYLGEKRVYVSEKALIEDLNAYFFAYRKLRPFRTGTPWAGNKDGAE